MFSMFNSTLRLVSIYILLLLIVSTTFAYYYPPPLELKISIHSPKDHYFRDDVIKINYTIQNRYGTSGEFCDNPRKHVNIYLPQNFTFKNISILTGNNNQVDALFNTSRKVGIPLVYSKDDWFTTYVNLEIIYNKSCSPDKFDFMKDRECIDPRWNSPCSTCYSKNRKECNITIKNRPPIIYNYSIKSNHSKNNTFICEVQDNDSEWLTLSLFNKNGIELAYNTSKNNLGTLVKKELNYNADNRPYYVLLSDEYNVTKKFITYGFDFNTILNNIIEFLYFFIPSILISIYIFPEISFIGLFFNRRKPVGFSIDKNPLKRWLYLSDLWLFILALVFGFHLTELSLVMDIPTHLAITLNIIMIIVTIIGYFKERIENLIPVMVLWIILLLATIISPSLSKFDILALGPTLFYIIYEHAQYVVANRPSG